MEVVAVLAEIDAGGDTSAAVVLDREADVWLVNSLTSAHGGPFRNDRPHRWGLDHARTLFAGRLPAGVVSAEAVTKDGRRVPCVVGVGVWLVVVDRFPSGARSTHAVPRRARTEMQRV